MTIIERMVALARRELPSKHVTHVTSVTGGLSEPCERAENAPVTLVTWLQPPTIKSPAILDQGEFDERAAIIEYDGGLPRDLAERLARLCLSAASHEHIDAECRRADRAHSITPI